MKHPRILWISYILLICLGAGYFSQGRQITRELRSAASGAMAVPGRKPTVFYGKLPLSFEANEGQTHNRVKFISRGRGYSLFLTGDETVLSLRSQEPGVRSQKRSWFLFRPPLQKPQHNDMWRDATNNGSQRTDVLRLTLVGANQHARVIGLEVLPGKASYFLGNDPKRWRTNVSTYAKVKYQGIYPGIDLVYYGNQGGQLEHDFIVAPGADPNQIRLAVGAGLVPAQGRPPGSPLRIDASGDLLIGTEGGNLRLEKPVVYQEQEPELTSEVSEGRNENRIWLDGRYVLLGDNHVGFAVPEYDRTRPLIIDPALVYATNLGGNAVDVGRTIAVDSSGNAYVAGETSSINFPNLNALQAGLNGSFNCFVTRLNAEGSALLYSTYLGGNNTDDCLGIAIDSSGNAYVTGYTNSTDFPTVNPLQATNKAELAHSGESTVFVAELNPTGSGLVYSTYLGGSYQDTPSGIAVDSSRSVYITGSTISADFPTVHPFQSACKGCAQLIGTAFVAKIGPAGSAITYSTFLGGSGGDGGAGIAVDSSGNAYVTGMTGSRDFPTLNPIQAANRAKDETAFVAKLNSSGSALVYSTYLGGSLMDVGAGIAVDPSGNACVTGQTSSTDFPTVNPLQSSLVGDGAGFVAKLNATGSALVYSTYLGGATAITPNMGLETSASAIAVDAAGNAYVTGETDATDFPTVDPIQSTCLACSAESGNAFVAELNSAGSALVFSTYLGGSFLDVGSGIAVDSTGHIYVTGENDATDFPGAPPLQANPQGLIKAFVAKIVTSPAAGPAVTLSTHLLSFLNEPPGTTSAVESVLLRSVGSDPVAIMAISVSGEFALTPTSSSCPYSGGRVASGAVCTIDVTFTPTETGLRTGSVTIDDNSPGSPRNVSLTGTGVASAPQATVSPASVTFGTQWANTASAPQPVTLSNTGNAPLLIASISISGMFTQTNNCGSSLAAGSSCTINVVFLPAEGGVLPRTMYITDNSNGIPNSMQSVSLNGTYQDFTMTWLPNSSSALTIPRGQSANYVWAVAAVGGFNHAVNFSCSVAPFGAGGTPSATTSCSLSPSVVTPPGSTQTNITVKVNSAAPSLSAPRTLPPLQPCFPGPKLLLTLAALMVGTGWMVRGLRQQGQFRRRAIALSLATGLLVAAALAGCGGGPRGTVAPPDPSPPAQTVDYYLLTLTGTATSGSLTLTNATNIELYVP